MTSFTLFLDPWSSVAPVKRSPKTNYLGIPTEIWLQVCLWLDPEDILNLIKSCRTFAFSDRFLPLLLQSPLPNTSWPRYASGPRSRFILPFGRYCLKLGQGHPMLGCVRDLFFPIDRPPQFRLLSFFPNLRSLDLGEARRSGERFWKTALDLVPKSQTFKSVTFLRAPYVGFTDNQHHENLQPLFWLLNSTPNLKHLTIVGDNCQIWYHPVTLNGPDVLQNLLKSRASKTLEILEFEFENYIVDLYQFVTGLELPDLKIVRSDFLREFHRTLHTSLRTHNIHAFNLLPPNHPRRMATMSRFASTLYSLRDRGFRLESSHRTRTIFFDSSAGLVGATETLKIVEFLHKQFGMIVGFCWSQSRFHPRSYEVTVEEVKKLKVLLPSLHTSMIPVHIMTSINIYYSTVRFADDPFLKEPKLCSSVVYLEIFGLGAPNGSKPCQYWKDLFNSIDLVFPSLRYMTVEALSSIDPTDLFDGKHPKFTDENDWMFIETPSNSGVGPPEKKTQYHHWRRL